MNEKNSLVIAPNYQNALTATASHYKVMIAFVRSCHRNRIPVLVRSVKAQMQRDVDYGVIPGTSKPNGHLTVLNAIQHPCPPLLKPGAEKLCRLFNLRPSYELIQSVADKTKPLFHYHYRCVLYRSGEMVGSGDGCCTEMEVKYQKQKHRIYDLTNTICKIAQKRALVAAVLSSCGASEKFTQDLDD